MHSAVVRRTLIGFFCGAAVAAVVTVLTLVLALTLEQQVNLAPLADATFSPGGPVEFSLELGIGWLGSLLPLLGLVAGAVLAVLPRRRENPRA